MSRIQSRFAISSAAALLAVSSLGLSAAVAHHTEDHAAAGQYDLGEHSTALDAAIAHERRDADRARDDFRHPKETLSFFGVTPDMTVLEVGPGGGWYSKILLPYLADDGQLLATNYSPETRRDPDAELIERLNSWPARFVENSAEFGPEGASADAYLWGGFPEEVVGTVDAALFFRALHGYTGQGSVDRVIAETYSLLKPGGMVGVVQHRAKADASDEYANGSKGYLREADVIARFEAAGFVLEAAAEINANPKDTADYENGVWTLPPSGRGGEDYAAIGESDRMTLKFRKPE